LGAGSEWLLKNCIFVKIAGIWEIENVYQNGDRRLLGFLLQSFFDHFPASEFFNSHGIFRQLTGDAV
jgi:hypothetical protein